MKTGIRTVYLLTNKINGKQYVGQTSDYKARMRTHNKKSSRCTALVLDIDEYGWDSFDKEVLHEDLSNMEADFYERWYIEMLYTLDPIGYNLETGGNINKKLSNETKKKLSDRRKEQINKIKMNNSNIRINRSKSPKKKAFQNSQEMTQNVFNIFQDKKEWFI